MSRKDIAKKLGVSMGSVNVYCNGAAQSNKTVKAAETSKKKTEIPVSNNWKELLKESVSAYISENIVEIIGEIPIQEIVNKAISEKMKAVVIGGPAPAAEKKPEKKAGGKPVAGTDTVETSIAEKPVKGKPAPGKTKPPAADHLSKQEKKKLGAYYTSDKLADILVNLAGLKETDIVLDPTCGNGQLLKAAIRAGVPPSNCLGVDIDKKVIELDLSDPELKGVSFQYGDAGKDKVLESSFWEKPVFDNTDDYEGKV
jgi:type I restriction-modification system DNA methylase subunit